MYRNLLVYITHPHVETWNFKAHHRDRILSAFPKLDVKVCRNSHEFLKHLPSSEAVIIWYFKKEWMEKAKLLKMIATPAAGRDWIETDFTRTNLKILNGGFHGPMIAESVIGAMLYFCKAFAISKHLQSRKKWGRAKISQALLSLQGSRVTIWGFGKIGKEIGRKLKPFECSITGIKQNPEKDNPDYFDHLDQIIVSEDALDKTLKKTDHLILTLPRGPKTTGILTRKRFNLLPSSCYLYNVGRGNVYFLANLVEALERIAGAYIDVFEHEPLSEDSPLWQMKNVLIQPHLSAASPQYLDLFVTELIQNLQEELP